MKTPVLPIGQGNGRWEQNTAYVATAVIAGAIGYWSEQQDVPILLAGLSTGIVMIVGAFIALWSARSIEFWSSGNYPEEWWECRTMDITRAIGSETENYQSRIEHNDQSLEKNRRLLNICSRL